MISGVTQAAFGAPGAALRHQLSARPKNDVTTQRYGMTMWFSVRVGLSGSRNLGDWASCTGLGVDLHVDDVAVGAHYDSRVLLPVNLSYRDITLERAMTETDSAEVQNWLRDVTARWLNSAEGGAAGDRQGTTVTIELYHQLGATPVATWELQDVVPVSWSGPDLSSESGTVATERLVLAHGGFLNAGSREGTAAQRESQLLTLSGAGRTTEFQYNPASVTVARFRSVGFGDRQNGGAGNLQITGDQPWDLTLGDLWIEGASAVSAATGNLTAWLEPVGTETGKGPHILQVTMGTGDNPLLTRKVALNNVTIAYTRFTRDGTPSRAKLTLGFTGAEPVAAAAPAATVAEKSQGDGLPALRDGSSKSMRATAAANGVDDPLRVPNGTKLRVGSPA